MHSVDELVTSIDDHIYLYTFVQRSFVRTICPVFSDIRLLLEMRQFRMFSLGQDGVPSDLLAVLGRNMRRGVVQSNNDFIQKSKSKVYYGGKIVRARCFVFEKTRFE